MYWKPDPDLYPPYLRSRVRRGRGVGELAGYLPWLKTRDVPSRGTSSSPPGILVDRVHHLLSEQETIFFYLLERRSTTIDIREQWPILDVDRTLELSSQYGVRQQCRGKWPEPFTIDFVITERVDGEVRTRAASVKTAEEGRLPEVRQRLAVEYEWCREKGVPWTLVDTCAFDKSLLGNLRFLRSWFRHRHVPDLDQSSRFADCFKLAYARNVPLCELVDRAGRQMWLSSNAAQDVFRHCGWIGRIPVVLTQPAIALDRPLILKKGWIE